MAKHAYLIMAHTNFDQLKLLLTLLDDERNDIYIHFDKKVKEIPNLLEKASYFSRLHILKERISVSWGGFSQIKCEMLLMKEACRYGNYEYFHLLSGMDLPLRNQDDIHKFFRKHAGTEFLSSEIPFNPKWVERIEYYYFFQDIKGRIRSQVLQKILTKLRNGFVKLQIQIGYKRKLKGLNIHFGSNWFSLTQDAVKFIIENENLVNKIFHNTVCADELFVQTILANSPLYQNLYKGTEGRTVKEANLRLIDWQRGDPYVWRIQDYDELVNSNCLFARKFDSQIDDKIIRKIAMKVKKDF